MALQFPHNRAQARMMNRAARADILKAIDWAKSLMDLQAHHEGFCPPVGEYAAFIAALMMRPWETPAAPARSWHAVAVAEADRWPSAV